MLTYFVHTMQIKRNGHALFTLQNSLQKSPPACPSYRVTATGALNLPLLS